MNRLRLIAFVLTVVPIAAWATYTSIDYCSPTNWAECRKP